MKLDLVDENPRELKFITLVAYRCRHLRCKHDPCIQPEPDVEVPEDADASSIVRANIAELFVQEVQANAIQNHRISLAVTHG